MGTKGYVNRAKSGAVQAPRRARRARGEGGRGFVRPGDERPAGGPEHRVPGSRDRGSAGTGAAGEETFLLAADALSREGRFICRGFLEKTLAAALAREARALHRRGLFRPGEVGRAGSRQAAPAIRGDLLLWLEPGGRTAAQRALLDVLERFRLLLNRELFLCLDDLELQYAAYPPGAAYARHIDQFPGVRARRITVLLYLNPGWRPRDGGALRLFVDREGAGGSVDVLPRHNTFVCFRSDVVSHEVLPPVRLRYSLGGWFRVRPEIPLAGSVPRGGG